MFIFSSYSQLPCFHCDETLVLNNGFESYDMNCQSNLPFPPHPGFDFFELGCVDEWLNIAQTADLFFPNNGLPSIDPFITSNMAGLCYSPSPLHSEAIRSTDLLHSVINHPELYYSLSFDVAAACFDGSPAPWSNLVDIEDATLDISLVANGLAEVLETVSITENHNIRDGIQNLCIENINLTQQEYTNIELRSNTNSSSNSSCYILVDNIELDCHLDHLLYEIVCVDLGNNTFDFTLVDNSIIGITNPLTTYRWNFGDGTPIVNGGNKRVLPFRFF